MCGPEAEKLQILEILEIQAMKIYFAIKILK